MKNKHVPWDEARKNLEKKIEQFPALVLDCLDSAYLAGLEVNKFVPMGVSQWREHGKKYHYWDYFMKQAGLKGERRRIIEMLREDVVREMKEEMDEEMRKFRMGFAYKPKKKK